MRADSGPDVHAALRGWGRPQRAVVAVLLCVALPLAIFASTFAEMVATWWRSQVFTHCFLVFPAFAYLVWRERDTLADRPVRPAPAALIGVAACGFLVVLGNLAAALTPSFFALIGAAIFTVVAVLGWQFAAAIWVPLLFLFFAVPFGEVFVPQLIDWTADFTVAALVASGIPVYREGPNFIIPSGSWSVVDACSGIRYLLASMFAGWLYAWLTYRSTGRRLAFMLASVIVPIVANWVRAYLIVLLAHLSDNTIATGVDHFVYGWLFFGIVIGLLFWVGNFFREDDRAEPTRRVAPAPARAAVAWRGVLPVAFAAFVLLAGWQAAAPWLAGRSDDRPVVVQPVQPAHGWEVVAAAGMDWSPDLRAPAATLAQVFRKNGRQVALHVGVYRNQSQASELVNSTNSLEATLHQPWLFVSNVSAPIDFGRGPVEVNTALAKSRGESLVVRQWYWIDGDIVTSDARAKAGLALQRLRGGSDTSAWVSISAIDREGSEQAHASLRAFAVEMGPAVEAALRDTAAR